MIGAFALLCFATFAIGFTCIAIEYTQKAHYWRRYCITCGGEESALKVLEAAEALP